MTVQTLTANVPDNSSFLLVREDGSVQQITPTASAPTAAFYQFVLNSDGGLMTQEPALFFSSDFTLTDDPGLSTRVRLARPPLPSVSAADAGSLLQVDATGLWNTKTGGPFKGTYYVDPAATGVQTGSELNPFSTIAAAFAAAVALALTSAIIRIPPGVNVTENVVFPSTGGSWEIACDEQYTATTLGAGITGTITANTTTTATGAYRLTNLLITGNISGDAANGGAGIFYLTSVRHAGNVSLTATGTGVWVAIFRAAGSATPQNVSGATNGTCSVVGDYIAQNWSFRGNVTEVSPTPGSTFSPPMYSSFRGCTFGQSSSPGTAITIALNGASLYTGFFDCYMFGPITLSTTQTNYVVSMDGATLALVTGSPGSPGLTLGGAGNIVLKTMNANGSSLTTDAANRGSTALGARSPNGLYVLEFDATLLAAGTTGLLQVNAIYTDMTGTLVTVPVGGTLNIASAVGTKSSGSLVFHHNGAAAPLAFSTTGIVTPGAMSVSLAVAVRRAN